MSKNSSYIRTPEIRSKLSKTLKKKHKKDKNFRKRFLTLMHSEEYRNKVSAATKGKKKDPDKIKAAKERGAWNKTDKQKAQISKSNRIAYSDPETRKHASEAQLLMREENPDWVVRNAIAVAEGKRKSRKTKGHKKTKPEIKLEKFLRLHNLKYRYVGNWSLTIKSYNPDFVHKRFKWIIEMQGRYWHKDRKELDAKRVKTFISAGYKVLIIWDDELEDTKRLRNKISKFHKRHK